MTATFYAGDAVTVMNTLPEKSVDLILTSPPFLALRSYLPQDHPDKALEGGSQATPGGYIDWLLDVVEACARVLAPHGSLCFELGDTYSGSGGAGGDYASDGLRDGQPGFDSSGKRGGNSRNVKTEMAALGIIGKTSGEMAKANPGSWPLAKSLSLIPETFRFAMVYGINPHTGRTTPPWRLRNVIRWVRPNPPVGALGDKFRPATSELMVFCKAKDRFFDLDAVREPYADKTYTTLGANSSPKGLTLPTSQHQNLVRGESMNHSGAPPLDWWNIPLLEGDEETRYGPKERTGINPAQASPKERNAFEVQQGTERREPGETEGTIWVNTSMANRTYSKRGNGPPLDWWEIPPGGYPGAHYAVWPPELLIKPIKAMCPEKVCRRCGEASRRIVGEAEYRREDGTLTEGDRRNGWTGLEAQQWGANTSKGVKESGHVTRQAPTLGFSDCLHDDYRPGLVLDPFAGSGTTLSVATGHGRDAIGIDLDERNYELALERVGPLVLQRGEIRDGTGPPD